MAIKKVQIIGLVSGIAALILDVIFFFNNKPGNMNLFYFIFGIAVIVAVMPFILGIITQSKKEEEISSMFLEFSRNLAESVTTGTPISKSIINVSNKNYGPLSPYIKKLSNQISLGVPVNQALSIFAHDVHNPVISRAVALISEAEKAGGEIDYILDSVAKSISEVEKLKKERKSAISTLVVQGYIIFFIFIGIMLVMQFKILPLTAGLGAINTGGASGALSGLGNVAAPSVGNVDVEMFSRPFLYLLLTQGIFAGLTIGKLAEGSLKAGIKHSFILTVVAFLVSTGAKVILG